MRNVSFCLLLFSSFGFSQNIQFTDPDLLFYLTTRLCVDTDGNGTFDSTADFNNDDEISFGEAQQVTSFSFTTLAHQIQSLGGFENFINLEKINVTTISVSHLDFSVWPLLQSIKLSSSIDSFVFDNVSLTHLEIQNIGFNDPVFDLTNLPNLEYLKASNNFLNDNFIFGIHNNLEELRINSGTFSSVDLSGMPALKYLSITDFIGTEINISNCTLLETFILRYTDNLNAIIGIGASSVLEKIEFKQVNIGEIPSNLDLVFNNQSLVDVSIRGANSVSISNNISDIGVIELNTINEAIAINNCSFTYIDNFLDSTIEIIGVNSGEIFLTNIENLRTISINVVSSSIPLDLSTVMVEKIFINTSSFPELNLKNGNNLILFSANYESEIAFICVDPGEFSIIENGLSNEEFTTVIHPYCTFVLGGEYYEITGDILVELGNGCISYENAPIFDLQFTLTDGSNTDIFYPNSTNNYSYTLPEGNHELTSQLIDLDLWTVSPSSINLSFPLDSSPYVQNFCITPSSTFNDAEIILIPLNSGIPGMQANYKLIYKNKGNTMLSGSVDLLFNDDVMNFLAASTNVNYQSTGNLSWNYTNLMPFETREISFSMLLNTPTDPNFPLNLEDLLNYTATINNSNPDETPNNNTFTLNQTILNSYDPNDIRCLEGNTLAIDQVGDYVHYLIRFENIGTSNASNVVIKDILDATKFDYSTLVPLNASHNFYTRIVNGNEVEFIFENIQLPFDDADNDGYVVFKIKTLETLLLGDSFSNQAAIYFDFNFPIITNNETTSIVDESLSNNVFNNLPISIFPNPTKNNLNIQSKSAILKISIYDLNGRLLNNVQPNSNQTEYKLDVENLSNGVYFLNVHAGKTKQILKFVKN